MEIRATGTLDFQTMRAFTHLCMFKKANPKKKMTLYSVLCALVIVMIVVWMLIFGADSTMIILLCCLWVLFLLEAFMYFKLPKIRYRSLGKMKDVTNKYVFGEAAVEIVTKGEEYEGKCAVMYSSLSKVMENSKYFYIYQNQMQVFIVEKSTVVGGTAEEIRQKLSAYLREHYIICKY